MYAAKTAATSRATSVGVDAAAASLMGSAAAVATNAATSAFCSDVLSSESPSAVSCGEVTGRFGAEMDGVVFEGGSASWTQVGAIRVA